MVLVADAQLQFCSNLKPAELLLELPLRLELGIQGAD